MLLKLSQLSEKNHQKIEVNSSIYGIELSKINKIAIAQVVRWQLHKCSGFKSYAKGRSEISGSGKKIYRQKGTGNARHSDKYAPQFRKGGIAHGPKAQQWTMKVPKKIRSLALRHTLSMKAQFEKLFIVDSLSFDLFKTKDVINHFSEYLGSKVLFIGSQSKDAPFVKSTANIVNFNYLPVIGMNVYDILKADFVVIERDSLCAIEKRLIA